MLIGLVCPYYFKEAVRVFQERVSSVSPDVSFEKLIVPDRANLFTGARKLENSCDVVVLFDRFVDKEELEKFEKQVVLFSLNFKKTLFRCFVVDDAELDKHCEFFINFHFYPEKLKEKIQKKSFNFL